MAGFFYLSHAYFLGRLNENCFDFPDLLRLVDSIPGDFWIRFATSHPKDMSDELIRTVAECDKVCDHIHLPAQSGDNKILDKMNRGYTREDYLRLIEKIRDKIPLVSVTTDIIVGFPGETVEQFDNTKKLFAAVKFDMAYIAQYSPRPGTAAAKLEDDVPPAEKKRRARELTRLLKAGALANNRQYLGKTLKVLVKGQRRTGEHWGETNSGKKVLIKAGKTRLENGVFVDIKIEAARDFGLAGTPG